MWQRRRSRTTLPFKSTWFASRLRFNERFTRSLIPYAYLLALQWHRRIPLLTVRSLFFLEGQGGGVVNYGVTRRFPNLRLNHLLQSLRTVLAAGAAGEHQIGCFVLWADEWDGFVGGADARASDWWFHGCMNFRIGLIHCFAHCLQTIIQQWQPAAHSM